MQIGDDGHKHPNQPSIASLALFGMGWLSIYSNPNSLENTNHQPDNFAMGGRYDAIHFANPACSAPTLWKYSDANIFRTVISLWVRLKCRHVHARVVRRGHLGVRGSENVGELARCCCEVACVFPQSDSSSASASKSLSHSDEIRIGIVGVVLC